jgi:hypothetical protein
MYSVFWFVYPWGATSLNQRIFPTLVHCATNLKSRLAVISFWRWKYFATYKSLLLL